MSPKIRFTDLLKFSKPKTMPYGVSGRFYVSVMTGRAQLPAPQEWVNPKGTEGCVAGFVVPLSGETDKSRLTRPMERGAYALASPDQKTVLKVLVLSKEEAGFHPESCVATSCMGDDLIQRIRSTWMLVQFTYQSFAPEVLPAVEFLHQAADRLAVLTDGAIADPMSRRYVHPGQFAPASIETMVPIGRRDVGEGVNVFTMGLQKFDLPEVELTVDPPQADLAEWFLGGVIEGILKGQPLELGQFMGNPKKPLQITAGGLDRGFWEGTPAFELIPPPGQTVSEAVQSFHDLHHVR
ncbi:MAG: hypothetical protein LCH41_01350 [Armatimonadetes bacterium]|nr:hypothetical protein [Armatimonadota bacterium]